MQIFIFIKMSSGCDLIAKSNNNNKYKEEEYKNMTTRATRPKRTRVVPITK